MKWSMRNKDINFCKNIRILKKALSAQYLLITISFSYRPTAVIIGLYNRDKDPASLTFLVYRKCYFPGATPKASRLFLERLIKEVKGASKSVVDSQIVHF